jgi:hypothetical protein
VSRTVRPGTLVALLLVAAIVAILPIRNALALTITVDGNPADWPPGDAPAGPRIGTDPADLGGGQAGVDIGALFFTNNPSTLFFRVDTQPGSVTLRTGTTMWLYLDTVPGGNNLAPSSSGNISRAPQLTDFVLEVTGSGLARTFYTCSSGACLPTTTPPASFQRGNTGTNNVTEFGIAPSEVGVTSSTTSINIAAGMDGPGGNDDTTSFFTTTVPGPLPVTLTGLAAERQDGGVAVTWETSGEIGVAGYHVLRSATAHRGDAVRVSDALIPASGDGVTGGSYRLLDAGAAPGVAYRYWLQVIGADGQVDEEYGPVAVGGALGAEHKVHLPLVRR